MTNFIFKLEHTEENEAMVLIAHSVPNARRLASRCTQNKLWEDEDMYTCTQIGISHIGKEQIFVCTEMY